MQIKKSILSNHTSPLARITVLGLGALLGLASPGCSDDDDTTEEMAGGGTGGGSMAGGGMGGGSMAGGGMGGTGMGSTGGGMLANGLTVPEGVFDWRVLGAITRGDNGQARVVVGNDTAVDAARAGNTNPWPEGSMIAHYVWSGGENPVIANAVVPDGFGALTLMVKDSAMYADDGGWAYGVWQTPALTPAAAMDANGNPFDQGCIDCHTDNVADNDYVFTEPGDIPSVAAFGAAADAPNGLSLPAGFADWRVIGFADRSTPDGGTFRVVLGNDAAVDAARAGNTDPWPEGSRLGHLVWAPGSNAATDAVLSGPSVVPGAFQFVTLMEKSTADYAADGGWAYGVWSGLDLTPNDELDAEGAAFDQACINCHTDSVADRDYVFTEPGEFPAL